MENQTSFKVEKKLSNKIIISIICLFIMIIFSWLFFTEDVINYKIAILSIFGMIILLGCILKTLLCTVLVNGNEIKYQSRIIPSIYKTISFNEINRIIIVTKTANPGADNPSDGVPYDVMHFCGNKGRLFSVTMDSKNGKHLYEVAISHGVHVEDKRKK